MFMGAFLGDALGAPHEFRCNANTPYTGILEHKGFMTTQFQGRKELQVSQVTDDSEASLALLRQLVRDKGYIEQNVIMAYLRWANSGGWMLGKNTRALLKGITTFNGYKKRYNKIVDAPESERSQSNGAMMRCSPLALLSDYDCVTRDVMITNPVSVCVDANYIYITALRLALTGKSGAEIFEMIKDSAQTPEVKEVLRQVASRENRDIVDKKGWCLNALWCALIVMISFTNYTAAMDWIIREHPGSDTDTNACIAGALLGAILGFEELNSEPNMNININRLLTADINNGPTPRPSEYQPHDFYALTEEAYKLTL